MGALAIDWAYLSACAGLYALAGYGWFTVVVLIEPLRSTRYCAFWAAVWPVTAILLLALTVTAKVQRSLRRGAV